jgi:hypothetical protein
LLPPNRRNRLQRGASFAGAGLVGPVWVIQYTRIHSCSCSCLDAFSIKVHVQGMVDLWVGVVSFMFMSQCLGRQGTWCHGLLDLWARIYTCMRSCSCFSALHHAHTCRVKATASSASWNTTEKESPSCSTTQPTFWYTACLSTPLCSSRACQQGRTAGSSPGLVRSPSIQAMLLLPLGIVLDLAFHPSCDSPYTFKNVAQAILATIACPYPPPPDLAPEWSGQRLPG